MSPSRTDVNTIEPSFLHTVASASYPGDFVSCRKLEPSALARKMS